jgi:glycosyltransferase involved in cell wall biosynthesis
MAVSELPTESIFRRLAGSVTRRALARPWEDRNITEVAELHRVDLWVGAFGFEGLGPQRPLLVYYPDFQHRHCKEFFDQQEFDDRERQWSYVLKRANGIVFISEATAADARLSGPVGGNVFVCGDRPVVRPEDLTLSPDEIRTKYRLPKRFFLVSNQFWVHKNHSLVIRALSALLGHGQTPPVVAFTGQPYDYRRPAAFNSILQQIQTDGLHDYCRLLGMLPRNEQIALIRAANAVIQPSRFEGRGNISEEVCLLGTQLLCSDLPVHRELNLPNAVFFPVDGDAELASLLGRDYPKPDKSTDLILQESRNMSAEYGESFMKICERVLANKQMGGSAAL